MNNSRKFPCIRCGLMTEMVGDLGLYLCDSCCDIEELMNEFDEDESETFEDQCSEQQLNSSIESE